MKKEPRRTVLQGSDRTKQRCIRPGCKGFVTLIAAKNGDPFCSRECAVAHYEEAAERLAEETQDG